MTEEQERLLNRLLDAASPATVERAVALWAQRQRVQVFAVQKRMIEDMPCWADYVVRRGGEGSRILAVIDIGMPTGIVTVILKPSDEGAILDVIDLLLTESHEGIRGVNL
jgi:hypothetical protein